jgi:CO/xanthine dehydrogenase Mo-binding subunit
MMARPPLPPNATEPERYELSEVVPYHFSPDRRMFLQTIAGGFLLLAVVGDRAEGQGRTTVTTVEAPLRFTADGTITVLNGKVEEGQGARTEIAMAAAEELRVPVSQVQVQMADTDVTPDDWITAGSSTTPATVAAIRQASATGRELLRQFAAKRWKIDGTYLTVKDGKVTEPRSRLSVSYAEMARDTAFLREAVKIQDAPITPPANWTTLGKPLARVNRRDIVTGTHHFPSDIQRPRMLYGAILRPPAYGAKLKSLGEGFQAPNGVTLVQDKEFVGFVASTSFAARKAAEAAAQAAIWDRPTAPEQAKPWESFRQTGQGTPAGKDEAINAGLARATKRIEATFEVPYIQHAPMEPRAAVAEWNGDRLTVWTGTSGPFRVRQDLAEAFGLKIEQVRVIIPDFGGGFGGKHTGEAAIEAAPPGKRSETSGCLALDPARGVYVGLLPSCCLD